ncbi:DMT family transporter [Rhizobiaceae bacterium n13]|uniref:DMT family transporter n=1 Tax=Ferirhizobium litorale TaxID=2927786 RepID=A0AAE3U0I1_9HYPH|nr:DMT family transporter [Fererhizobium litorale]MDI7861239.1 DMT family transporter [Fererhizobium litorale]MDI7921386.1 DMT family transporter [Fererhizobium litorale]
MGADDTNPMKGILLKVSSVVVFLIMQTCIKLAGTGLAAGQITFYRSAFAIIPIAIYLAYRGELRSGFYTRNPVGHLKRGAIGILAMGLGFYGLVHLPLPEAIAIGYAMPLFAVAFAAIFLGENVRLYRWTAVLVGLSGVMIITWPKLTLFSQAGLGSTAATGAVAVLLAAACGAMAMIQVRRLVEEEKTPTIVLYFSLTASVFSLATVPFGWDWLSMEQTALLVIAGFCGGIAQILLTECYRYADVSTIAPFEYTSILLGIVVAYVLFEDVPTMTMLAGTLIVVGAGIYIIYREHRLGLERRAARRAEGPRG